MIFFTSLFIHCLLLFLLAKRCANKRNQDLQKELSTLQAKLQTTEDNLAGSQKEIEQLKEQSTKALAQQAQEKIEELNNKLQEATNSFENEKKQIVDTLENGKKEIQTQLEQSNNANNELKQLLDQKEKECHALSTRLEELEETKRQKEEIETKETSYLESLKKKAEDDPLFANPKKANKWTLEEVSLWLFRIRSQEYIDAFKKHRVDGSMLLNDLKSQELTNDIGVQPYHVGKIAREIQKLKENAEAILTVSDFTDIRLVNDSFGLDPQEVKQLKQDLETQQRINEVLQFELSNLEREVKETPGGPGHNVDEHNDEPQYGERERGHGTVVFRQSSMEDDVKREYGANAHPVNATAQVKKLEQEISRIELSKVNLAIALNEQIEYLR
ncbi:hypothetical protein RFI_13468 [Reticulomyxa filosa]|uniref:SAM domain-containing protein n=1 Tax=Reticulomyxa filosa TaxID=46433 RepID=X6NCI8_RETFI|nr:hypothetical protein RFI_13468 [Reticulomyxa filosa]|eukprot:ETO23711.1 hypothetical protein RFI_13468 [Reticulomyxa filosa]